ncbi:hypothetical protein P376_3836 [Streptomyces sp. HCCB10043]|nr:hypothetical protein P376_3836 [Streptomyces sp. HCCB10043]
MTHGHVRPFDRDTGLPARPATLSKRTGTWRSSRSADVSVDGVANALDGVPPGRLRTLLRTALRTGRGRRCQWGGPQWTASAARVVPNKLRSPEQNP